jgi:hypothetical protein
MIAGGSEWFRFGDLGAFARRLGMAWDNLTADGRIVTVGKNNAGDANEGKLIILSGHSAVAVVGTFTGCRKRVLPILAGQCDSWGDTHGFRSQGKKRPRGTLWPR